MVQPIAPTVRRSHIDAVTDLRKYDVHPCLVLANVFLRAAGVVAALYLIVEGAHFLPVLSDGTAAVLAPRGLAEVGMPEVLPSTTTTTTIAVAVLKEKREAAEEAVVDKLVAELRAAGGFREDQSIAVVEGIRSEAGVTSAAIVDTGPLAATGMEVQVAVSTPSGETIPASVTSGALLEVNSLLKGNVIVLVTAIEASLLATYRPEARDEQPGSAKLTSTPVSIRLVDEGGHDIKILEPIEVTFALGNKTDDMICGWFDDHLMEWCTDSIEFLRGGPGDNLSCSTSHLSVLGAVTKSPVFGIACFNAEILTWEGLLNLGNGEWWYKPGAILLWALIVAEMALMVHICQRSAYQRRGRGWSDEHLLTESVAFDVGASKEAQGVLKDQTTAGIVDRLTARVTRMAVASRESLNQEDLVAILQGGSNRRAIARERLRQHGAARQAEDEGHLSSVNLGVGHISMLKDLGDAANNTLTDFMRQSFLRRTMVLFCSSNAWISLRQFSFTIPPTFRVLMLCVRLHSSLLCSAFFFAGSAPSKDAPEECSPDEFWEKAEFNIVISMFSVMVGAVPFALMGSAAARSFVFRGKWDVDEKRKCIAKWRRRNGILWLLGALHVCFCTLYVATFLANVAKGPTVDWVTTTIADLLLNLLLAPLLKALSLAMLFGIVFSLRPRWVQSQIKEIESTFTKLVEDDTSKEPSQGPLTPLLAPSGDDDARHFRVLGS